MEFVAITVLGALVWKFVDFLKYLKNHDWNAVLTMLSVWVAGVVAVLLFAHSDFASLVSVGSATLASLGTVSQVIIGLSATSLMSVGYDFKKSLDNTDSAKTPSLMG